MTASHPSYRSRGLATWLKQHTLRELAAAGVHDAWAANDSSNAPMLAVNRALGYQPTENSCVVERRL